MQNDDTSDEEVATSLTEREVSASGSIFELRDEKIGGLTQFNRPGANDY
mgnify:CR=1 FL=1